jgi:hypothetical protein
MNEPVFGEDDSAFPIRQQIAEKGIEKASDRNLRRASPLQRWRAGGIVKTEEHNGECLQIRTVDPGRVPRSLFRPILTKANVTKPEKNVNILTA